MMCPTASEGRGYRMAASEFEGTVIPDTLYWFVKKMVGFQFVLFRVIWSYFVDLFLSYFVDDDYYYCCCFPAAARVCQF